MPGYRRILQLILPPAAVIGVGVGFDAYKYQQHQQFQQLIELPRRIPAKNNIVKPSIPKSSALAVALFLKMTIHHPAEIRAIMKSMQKITDKEGNYLFKDLDYDSLKRIAAYLQSGQELNYPEFILYCRLFPAYRNSETGSEAFILSELQEQYPDLKVDAIVNDVEAKRRIFQKVNSANEPFTLTESECLWTTDQYKLVVSIRANKTQARETTEEVIGVKPK
jgi:hypothetical protein